MHGPVVVDSVFMADKCAPCPWCSSVYCLALGGGLEQGCGAVVARTCQWLPVALLSCEAVIACALLAPLKSCCPA